MRKNLCALRDKYGIYFIDLSSDIESLKIKNTVLKNKQLF